MVRSTQCAAFGLPAGGTVGATCSGFALEAIVRPLVNLLQDRYLSIDLEWKPEFKRGISTRIALMQLASSSCCLLIRLNRMGKRFPPALQTFLR